MLKKMKLATKTAMTISAVLIICFVIFILSTIILTNKSLTTTIRSEFNNLAEKNAVKVQAIFDTSASVATDLQNYMENMYVLYDQQIATNTVDTSDAYSKVYKQKILPINLEIENYTINTIKSAVSTNEDLMGVGVFYEPYAYDPSIKDYSIYIQSKNPEEIQTFGDYSNYANESYYSVAKETKKIYFTPPFEYEGDMIISACYPIIFKGDVQGVIVTDIKVNTFSKVSTKNQQYSTIYNKIYTSDGIIVFDSNDLTKNIGKSISEFITEEEDLNKTLSALKDSKPFELKTEIDGKLIQCFYYPISTGSDNWWALSALESSDMNKAAVKTTIWLTVLAIIALVVIMFVTILILRKMLRPIQDIVKAAESISMGNFDIHLEAKSDDEIGILTTTFSNTASILKTVIVDITHVLNEIANKNLFVSTSANYVGELTKIETALNNIIYNLNDFMTDINQSANQVALGSDQVSSGAQALSQGATEQASSIQELSATITEISNQIKQNAENALNAKIEAEKAGKEIMDSNGKMQDMIQAMNDISNKSDQIEKIIKTIDDIAFQTNILALNAAVEAARAGSAGKGFAVVADEVRNLAGKSAEAAKNTALLIQDTIKSVQSGTEIAADTAQSMLAVIEEAKSVTTLVEDIAGASEKQAIAISQVTLGVEQISSVVQSNSATAEESAASSEELSGQAQILKDLVEEFKLKNEDSIESDKNYTGYDSFSHSQNNRIENRNTSNDKY